MQELSEPDDALVSRVLSEVGFENRLTGYRFRQRVGAMPASLYSFEEVVHLLNDRFPRLSFQRLEEWLRTVIRDEELATRTADAVEREDNDHDRTERIGILMRERLCQCMKVAHLSGREED